jgi:rubrerythrin
MSDKNEEILNGLKTAMEAELTGYNFYRNAAQNVSDPKGKETLYQMAEEEVNHFNYLRHQYQSVIERGKYDFSKAFIKKDPEDVVNPIFSDAIKERIKDCHYEMSVLSIGMKLELEAFQYYHSCAQKALTEEARKFFEELVVWEKGHYRSFAEQMENLKEAYWEANKFIPT